MAHADWVELYVCRALTDKTQKPEEALPLRGGRGCSFGSSSSGRIAAGMVLASRFTVARRLGAGSMGQVFSVFDQRRQAQVALKVLGSLSPRAVMALKTEFRAASELVHPNLVRLHELFCDEGRWFFTMDLVEGLPLQEWLRDTGGLRQIFRQLAWALEALHGAGTLHRDLKPSNFLITREHGRVVLLDFGLAHPIGVAGTNEFSGTPAYMSPEQCWGESLVAASDWYAFGVVLYESLTGSLPGRVPSKERLGSAPPDLAELCLGLMNLEAARRPGVEEILLCLDGGGRKRRDTLPPVSRSTLIDRDVELETLRSVFDGTVEGVPAWVHVQGGSGIGKSALVEHFVDAAAERGALVLRSRCRERESMSYKALDGLIDELVRRLHVMPEPEVRLLLPKAIAELVLLFPALSEVSVIAEVPHANRENLDQGLLRWEAVTAFCQLLGSLRKRGPLIVWLDDLQWSDSESALVLGRLIAGPESVPLLLIGSYRGSVVSEAPLFDAMSAGSVYRVPPATQLRLAPLAPAGAALLAQRNLPVCSDESEALAVNIAREAGGHPLFVKELAFSRSCLTPGKVPAKAEPATLAQLFDLRIGALSESACQTLELAVLTRTPLSRGTLRKIQFLTPMETEQALDLLRAARLAQSVGVSDDALVEIYHDRVRVAVTSRLSQERRRARHLQLAQGLRHIDGIKSEVLAGHYDAAELPGAAGQYWAAAGSEAMQGLAFSHAVELLMLALARLTPLALPIRLVQQQLAEALTYAGRGPEAATRYLQLAELSDGDEAVEFRRKAAEELLLAGHIDGGLELVASISGALGLLGRLDNQKPALVSLVLGRIGARLRPLPREVQSSPRCTAVERVRLDTYWTLSCSLRLIDPIRATPFHNRHLHEAFRVGGALDVLRAVTIEISYAGGANARTGRTRRLLSVAKESALTAGTSLASGLFRLARGGRAYLAGDPGAALPDLEVALGLLVESKGATWERITTERFLIASLFYGGNFERLKVLVPSLIKRSETTGNLYASMCFRCAFSTVAWLVSDDRASAEQQLARAKGDCATGRYDLSHYNLLLGQGILDLYRGDGERLYFRLAEQWPAIEGAQLMRLAVVASQVRHLRASSAICAAHSETDPKESSRLLNESAVQVSLLRRVGILQSVPLADLVEASIALARLQTDAAVLLLRQAIAGCDALGMQMFGAAARMQLGALLDNEEGARLADLGLRCFDEQRIARPEKMLNLLTPGFTPSRLGKFERNAVARPHL